MDKVMVETSRIRTHCFVSGPEDGVPPLLVHGNLTTGRFWQDVADGFPDGYRAGGGSVRELVVDGCGHGPPIERPAEVGEQLLAHIQGAA
jgi:pimeloyl-ACP methyl ester carboxylesterase